MKTTQSLRSFLQPKSRSKKVPGLQSSYSKERENSKSRYLLTKPVLQSRNSNSKLHNFTQAAQPESESEQESFTNAKHNLACMTEEPEKLPTQALPDLTEAFKSVAPTAEIMLGGEQTDVLDDSGCDLTSKAIPATTCRFFGKKHS